MWERQALFVTKMNPLVSAISLAFLMIFGAACVENFSTIRPVDQPRLAVVEVTPARGTVVRSVHTPISLRFDGPVDPRRSAMDRALSLDSGGFHVPVSVRYDPLERRLVATPADPLRPGLTYTWTLDAEAIVGSGGFPLRPIAPISVVVARDATAPERSVSAQVTFDDVRPIFEAHCYCHSETALPQLTPSGLADLSRQRTGRSLVVPNDPAASYLVEKLLPDYPDRFGTAMPPPWSDGPDLDESAVRRIIEWIEDGAR